MYIELPTDVIVLAFPRDNIPMKVEEDDDLYESPAVPTSNQQESAKDEVLVPQVDTSRSELHIVEQKDIDVQPCPAASSATHTVTSVKREAPDSVSSYCLEV